MVRHPTKEIAVGAVKIGADNPIAIQSMTNTKTKDVSATIEQILRLEEAGCDIVRCAVPDMESAAAIGKIKAGIHIPLVADIHFDYRLALECMEQGVDKVRINPGNIGAPQRVWAVAKKAGACHIPIRIGVNGGSLEKEILKKYGGPTPQAIVESALGHVRLLEQYDFTDIVVSLKSSRVPDAVEAYRLFAQERDYPLHLGITEAGTLFAGTVKSSVGLGAMLCMGLGDTIRVSLTEDPVEEVRVAKQILRSLGLRDGGVEVISCPTCGRTCIDLISLAKEVEQATAHIKKNLTVAVMGCAVNGPGEAREADFGVAGGDGVGLLFAKGEILKKVPQQQIVEELVKLISKA